MLWKEARDLAIRHLHKRFNYMRKQAFDPELNGSSTACRWCGSGTYDCADPPYFENGHAEHPPCEYVLTYNTLQQLEQLSDVEMEDL